MAMITGRKNWEKFGKKFRKILVLRNFLINQFAGRINYIKDKIAEIKIFDLMKKKKLLKKILSSSKNIKFDEMVSLVEAFGFELDRVRGSHHIFKHPDIIGIVNIQNRKGKVQAYQIHLVLSVS